LLHIAAYYVILIRIDEDFDMQLLSIEDLAVYLGDSKRTIYKYIASGDCPPYIRINAKNIKFDRADVDAWLASKKVNPKSEERKNK
jgi:excisionase family DNA binding protein